MVSRQLLDLVLHSIEAYDMYCSMYSSDVILGVQYVLRVLYVLGNTTTASPKAETEKTITLRQVRCESPLT